MSRTDNRVEFNWGSGSFMQGQPSDHYSVRWQGYFIPKTTGDYKFYSSADDGVRFYLDDQLAIDDWQPHSETLDSFGKRLEAGHPYKIRFEYFESVGSAVVGFGVARAEDYVGRATKPLAQKADVAIVCVGFDPTTEGEGFDRTFSLPGGQDELIRQISGVNKNTIVVITSGGNVDMTKWIDNVAAVVEAWYPGQEGGNALAQLVFGDYSPSGKLPVSFEKRWEDNATFQSYYPQASEKSVKYTEGVFLGYRHFDKSNVKPMFPFGFGLSYTTFEYNNLQISPATANLQAPITVSFDVTNTGKRTGDEIAEVYVGDSRASVARPVRGRQACAQVALMPGEKERVTARLDRRAFSYYDVPGHDWRAEPGNFAILVGGSSDNLPLKGTFSLK